MEKLRIGLRDLKKFLRINQCEKFYNYETHEDYYNFVVSVTDTMFIKAKFFKNMKDVKDYLVNGGDDFCNISLTYTENKDLILDFEWQDIFPFVEYKLVGLGAKRIREEVELQIENYEYEEKIRFDNECLNMFI